MTSDCPIPSLCYYLMFRKSFWWNLYLNFRFHPRIVLIRNYHRCCSAAKTALNKCWIKIADAAVIINTYRYFALSPRVYRICLAINYKCTGLYRLYKFGNNLLFWFVSVVVLRCLTRRYVRTTSSRIIGKNINTFSLLVQVFSEPKHQL